MKKIIILLMTVSIMLTSCGKSAGLSNRNKGADNKTLSATGTGKKQLPQGTNYKNSSKKSSADAIKEYLHTASDFLTVHKFGLVVSSVLLILAGLVYHYRQDIFNNQKSELKQIKKADEIVKKVNKLVSDNEALKRENNGLNDDKKKLVQERNELISDKSGLLSEDQRKSGAISKFKITDTIQKNKIAEHEQTINELTEHLKSLSETENLSRQNRDLFNQLEQEKQEKQKLSDLLTQNEYDREFLSKQTQEQAETIEQLKQELQNTIFNAQQRIAELEKSKQHVLDQNGFLLIELRELRQKK